MIIYSVTSRPSFEQAGVMIDMVLRIKDSDHVPMMLCGNKTDLEDKREVSTQEGIEYARARGVGFIECSAKTRLNVEEGTASLLLCCPADLSGCEKSVLSADSLHASLGG